MITEEFKIIENFNGFWRTIGYTKTISYAQYILTRQARAMSEDIARYYDDRDVFYEIYRYDPDTDMVAMAPSLTLKFKDLRYGESKND